MDFCGGPSIQQPAPQLMSSSISFGTTRSKRRMDADWLASECQNASGDRQCKQQPSWQFTWRSPPLCSETIADQPGEQSSHEDWYGYVKLGLPEEVDEREQENQVGHLLQPGPKHGTEARAARSNKAVNPIVR